MPTVGEVEARLDGHIDVCTARYEGIAVEIRGVNARLKRLERIIASAAGAIIMLLLGIAFRLAGL